MELSGTLNLEQFSDKNMQAVPETSLTVFSEVSGDILPRLKRRELPDSGRFGSRSIVLSD